MALNPGTSVANFFVEIDNKPAGFLNSFTPPTLEVEEIKQSGGAGGLTKRALGNPKVGEAVATFSIGQGGVLLDWVTRVLARNFGQADIAVVLVDHNFQARRRIELPRSMITSVEFSALDAREAKKALEVTVTFQPEAVKYSKGSGKVTVASGTKLTHWLVNNFQVKLPEIDPRFISRVELPKITTKIAQESIGSTRIPTRHNSYEIDGLRIVQAGPAFDAAQGYVSKVLQDGVIAESEYTTITVEMLDTAMKQVLGTFTAKGCAPRKFTWSADAKGDQPETSCIDFFVEDLALAKK